MHKQLNFRIPDSQDIIRLSGELAYQYISYCQFIYYTWVDAHPTSRAQECTGQHCDHLDELLSLTIKRLLLRFLDNSKIQKLVLDNPSVLFTATKLWIASDRDITGNEQGLLVVPIYQKDHMQPFFLTTD